MCKMKTIDGFGLLFLASLIQLTFQVSVPRPLYQNLRKTPDDKFMSVTVCRGGRREIGCPNMELLHVFTAFYGKFSGHDCDDPITAVRSEIPTCVAKNAAQVVRETCHGQQSCDLYGEDDLYDNPCPSVMKYLYVSFTCQGKSNLMGKLNSLENVHHGLPGAATVQNQPLPAVKVPAIAPSPYHPAAIAPSPYHPAASATSRSVTLCNGKTQSIACPNLQLIRVQAAFFGKQQGKDCSGHLTRDTIPLCFAPNALAIVRDTCQGQQSCDLYSEQTLYGRTSCPPVEKYLQVTFICQGHSDVLRKLAHFTQQSSKQAPFEPWEKQYRAPYSSAWTPYYNAYFQMSSKSPKYERPTARSFAPKPPQYVKYGRFNGYGAYSGYGTPNIYGTVNANTRQFDGGACTQCNGDCNNWLCAGCGGCQTSPAVQQYYQTYQYPYQRQDAAFHDSFGGNEMQLSGLVFWPVPKMPKVLRKLNAKKIGRSQTYEDEADEESGSGGSGDEEQN